MRWCYKPILFQSSCCCLSSSYTMRYVPMCFQSHCFFRVSVVSESCRWKFALGKLECIDIFFYQNKTMTVPLFFNTTGTWIMWQLSQAPHHPYEQWQRHNSARICPAPRSDWSAQAHPRTDFHSNVRIDIRYNG